MLDHATLRYWLNQAIKFGARLNYRIYLRVTYLAQKNPSHLHQVHYATMMNVPGWYFWLVMQVILKF